MTDKPTHRCRNHQTLFNMAREFIHRNALSYITFLGGLWLPPRDTLNNHIYHKIISYKTGVLLSFPCDVYKYNRSPLFLFFIDLLS